MRPEVWVSLMPLRQRVEVFQERKPAQAVGRSHWSAAPVRMGRQMRAKEPQFPSR